MKNGLTVPEAVGYALAFSIALTVTLAQSSIWPHLFNLASILPARYVELLGLLPVATNTAVAFFVVTAAALGSVALMRHPSVGLGLLAGSVLATAGYPYGQLRWHRAFITLPIDETEPTVGLWIRGLICVLLLLVIPIVLQVRRVDARFSQKQVDEGERRAAKTHLIRLALQNTGLAVGFAALAALLLYGIRGIAGSGGRPLVEHSVLVMVAVAFLLVAAIGIGSGVFQKNTPNAPKPNKPDPQAQHPR